MIKAAVRSYLCSNICYSQFGVLFYYNMVYNRVTLACMPREFVYFVCLKWPFQIFISLLSYTSSRLSPLLLILFCPHGATRFAHCKSEYTFLHCHLNLLLVLFYYLHYQSIRVVSCKITPFCQYASSFI